MTANASAPDDAFALQEAQYRFGLGPIVVRAAHLVSEVEFDGEPWVHIRAQVANGTPERHGGWVDRELYVIASASPQAPGQRPHR